MRVSTQNSVTQINETFRKAAESASEGGNLLTKNELAQAVGHAVIDDFALSHAEKLAIAQGYANTFTGAGFAATDEAKESYAKLAKLARLPEVNVF